jgi:RHS repeat-associated protein
MVVETDGADAVQAVYSLEPAGYGNLVSQRRGATTSFYHFDGLGSTDRLSDVNGTVTDSYLYRAFGKVVVLSGSTVNPLTYVGRSGYYCDLDLRTYYLRARVYDPSLGRFLSIDPLIQRALSFLVNYDYTIFNLYIYSNNSSVNMTDPSGYCPPTPACAVPGSLLGCTKLPANCAIYWPGSPVEYFVCMNAGNSPGEQCARGCLQRCLCSYPAWARSIPITRIEVFKCCHSVCLPSCSIAGVSPY